jgi:hypothetical protein
MSLQRILIDQKIVTAALAHLVEIDRLNGAQGALRIAQGDLPCLSNKYRACHEIRESGWCENCLNLKPFFAKVKLHRRQINVLIHQLRKLRDERLAITNPKPPPLMAQAVGMKP